MWVPGKNDGLVVLSLCGLFFSPKQNPERFGTRWCKFLMQKGNRFFFGLHLEGLQRGQAFGLPFKRKENPGSPKWCSNAKWCREGANMAEAMRFTTWIVACSHLHSHISSSQTTMSVYPIIMYVIVVDSWRIHLLEYQKHLHIQKITHIYCLTSYSVCTPYLLLHCSVIPNRVDITNEQC